MKRIVLIALTGTLFTACHTRQLQQNAAMSVFTFTDGVKIYSDTILEDVSGAGKVVTKDHLLKTASFPLVSCALRGDADHQAFYLEYLNPASCPYALRIIGLPHTRPGVFQNATGSTGSTNLGHDQASPLSRGSNLQFAMVEDTAAYKIDDVVVTTAATSGNAIDARLKLWIHSAAGKKVIEGRVLWRVPYPGHLPAELNAHTKEIAVR